MPRALRSLLPLLALALAACAVEVRENPPPETLVKAPRPARRQPTARRLATPTVAPTASAALASPSARALAVRPSDDLLTHVDPPAPSPEATRLFRQSLSASPVALAAPTHPHRVLLLGLEGTARGEAAEMKTDGPAQSADLEEGQRARMPVSLRAGDCLTFIAQGGLGVVELDLFLTTGEGDATRILAQDTREGPIAVIGGKDGCFVPRASIDGHLDVLLRKGKGPVLLQRYVR
jgi:hypothetical protein